MSGPQEDNHHDGNLRADLPRFLNRRAALGGLAAAWGGAGLWALLAPPPGPMSRGRARMVRFA